VLKPVTQEVMWRRIPGEGKTVSIEANGGYVLGLELVILTARQFGMNNLK